MSNANAQSIRLIDGAHDVTVQSNLVQHSGDDSISVATYGTSSPLDYNIAIKGNTVLDQQSGRGIAVLGGHDVQVLSNHVEGGPADRAGIYVAAEPAYATPGNYNITVHGSTLKDTGGAQSGHGAITVWNGEGGTITNHDVTITNNQIDAPRQDGILIDGSPQSNFTVEHNSVYAPHGQAVSVVNAPATSTIASNTTAAQSSYAGDVVPSGGGAATDPNLSTFVVKMSETGGQGAAHFRFLIDGKQVGTDQAVTIQHAQGTQTFTFQADLLNQTVHHLDIVNVAPTTGSTTAPQLYLSSLTVNNDTLHTTNHVVTADTSFDVSSTRVTLTSRTSFTQR